MQNIKPKEEFVFLNMKEQPKMKTIIERYIKDNYYVGILVHKTYGSGWSTSTPTNLQEFFLFDKTLVQFKLDNIDSNKVSAYIDEKIGREYNYLAYELEHHKTRQTVWSDVVIQWIPQGNQIEITEFDGKERVIDHGPVQGYIA